MNKLYSNRYRFLEKNSDCNSESLGDDIFLGVSQVSKQIASIFTMLRLNQCNFSFKLNI